MPKSQNYHKFVFINCPFDDQYLHFRNASIFTILDCGFIPKCALEEDNSGHVRFEKIRKLIQDAKLAIHDISKTELDPDTKLPRFNMPFELGLFIGAKCFGTKKQQEKNCLILDKEPYRYQAFISDIAGHDIRCHHDQINDLIKCIRNWLSNLSNEKVIPGANKITEKFNSFINELPDLCVRVPIDVDELTYNDYVQFISRWLKKNI